MGRRGKPMCLPNIRRAGFAVWDLPCGICRVGFAVWDLGKHIGLPLRFGAYF
jgi:hypothetical protein